MPPVQIAFYEFLDNGLRAILDFVRRAHGGDPSVMEHTDPIGDAQRRNNIMCHHDGCHFETLLHESDVLTIHIHLTGKSRHLFTGEVFSKMKKGAYLINTSRGAILDDQAFLEALESGHLAGAGVDVIDGEWNANLQEHPLIVYANKHENLIITPHTGAHESNAMARKFTAQKLANYIKTFNTLE